MFRKRGGFDNANVSLITSQGTGRRHTHRRALRKLLVRLLIVSLSFVSVSTTLSTLPGATTNFWYLYLSPVFVSALSFGLRGALLGSAAAVVALTSLLFRLQQFLALAPESGALQLQLLGAAPQSGLRHIADIAVFAQAGETLLNSITVAGNGDGFALAVGQVGFGLLCMVLGACLIGQQADVQRRQDAVIQELALRDHLTGLANHRGLMERLDDAVADCTPFSLLLIDIDGLKSINDRFGHAAGDLALQHVGKLLRATVRTAGDLAARHGGDEFAVLVSGDPDGSAGTQVGERLLRTLSEHPLRLPQRPQELLIRASVGVASFGDDGSEPRNLLAVADQGMYAAKEAGGQLVIHGSAAPHSSGRRLRPSRAVALHA